MSESRKAFEVWAKLAFPHMSLLKKGDTDKYVYKTANFACEAFCEGEAWQASRQALEGEPVAEVAQVGGTPVVFWDKSLTVGTKLYTRPASRHALSSCSEIPNSSGHASRQALEGEPVAWWDGDTSAAEDSFSFKSNGYYTIPLYTHPASRQAVSVPDMWRDVDYEVPEQAQEVILVLGEKVVHGAWIGGMFWHNNRKVEATKWRPLPQPPNQEGQ